MVIIYDEIADDSDKHDFFKVNTDKLRAFIDRYGVDCVDYGGNHLFNYIDGMNKKQIDMIMEYKPRLDVIKDANIIYLLGFDDPRSVYALQKVIEYDTDFYLLKNKMQLKTPFISKDEVIMVNYLEYMRYMLKKYKIVYGNSISVRMILDRMIMMMENHEKRYYKLFDLLKHKIE